MKDVNNIDTSKTFHTPGVNDSDFNFILFLFNTIITKSSFLWKEGGVMASAIYCSFGCSKYNIIPCTTF